MSRSRANCATKLALPALQRPLQLQLQGAKCCAGFNTPRTICVLCTYYILLMPWFRAVAHPSHQGDQDRTARQPAVLALQRPLQLEEAGDCIAFKSLIFICLCSAQALASGPRLAMDPAGRPLGARAWSSSARALRRVVGAHWQFNHLLRCTIL